MTVFFPHALQFLATAPGVRGRHGLHAQPRVAPARETGLARAATLRPTAAVARASVPGATRQLATRENAAVSVVVMLPPLTSLYNIRFFVLSLAESDSAENMFCPVQIFSNF